MTTASATDPIDTTALLSMYRQMVVVRGFEERVALLYRDGEIPGFVHLCIGQEATAVGACSALRADDVITSTHRGHGHCLAKGLEPTEMFAELFGKQTGVCSGRGGSMHMADPRRGVFGANGIVGAGLPIAVGAALAAKIRKSDMVVVAMFGDGAVAQGAFHEAVNLASVWSLPIVFFCENNHVAEFSRESDQHVVGLAQRAIGYGLDHVLIDGNDVAVVHAATATVVEQIRHGRRPVIIEADTYRWSGHYEGDPQRYRDPADIESAKRNDPLARCRAQLRLRGVDEQTLIAVETTVGAELDAAIESARAAPGVDPSTLFDFVESPRRSRPASAASEPSGEVFRMMDAIHDAIEYEMTHDENVFVLGVDAGRGGNVFGLTRGLHARWPDRMLDTPISETAVMGAAVGAAMAGMRPVAELMYLDFIGVCLDPLLNQAAKLRFMTGGKAQVPMVMRTQFGAGHSSGSQHSQSLEVLLAHIPGLTVVMPSTPADAYGLLRAAIRDDNPVVFIENRLLYGMKGPKPPPDHILELGKAKVVRTGRDVTVVSVSRILHDVMAAAELLAPEGIDVEVIDLRTVSPLDRDTILESVRKTSRLVVVHEAVQAFGIGGEIASVVAEHAFWHLDVPIVRVGSPTTPVPYTPVLEQQWLPDIAAITSAIRTTVRT
jgi:2-oxoisovalerate dehydrogenase E1 component